MEDVATYVYCLVDALRPPTAEDAPQGLEGAGSPRLLGLGDGLWMVAADAPLELYGGEAIERGMGDLEWVSRRALEHESVVEHFLHACTVVPMKLFTLYSSDERARADIASRRARVDDLLGVLRGRQEWGVRVFLDRDRARRPVAAEARPESGRAFLEEKLRRRDAGRRALEEAGPEAERLFEELSALAAGARHRPPAIREEGGGRLVLDAAFLVPNGASADFSHVVEEKARELADAGLRVDMTGPWPPYNFVDEG